MKFSYLLVNGSADGDGLTTVSHLSGNEKLVPYADDPLPFFLEYSEEVDALEALKPYLKILVALSAQRGVIGHKVFGQALASAMASAVTEVWPHRTQLFGIMNSRCSARKIITHNQDTLMGYVGGDLSAISLFPTVVHAIVWLACGGNKGLKEAGLKRWTAITVKERNNLGRIARSPRVMAREPIVISDDDDESGDKMVVDSKPAVKGKAKLKSIPPSLSSDEVPRVSPGSLSTTATPRAVTCGGTPGPSAPARSKRVRTVVGDSRRPVATTAPPQPAPTTTPTPSSSPPAHPCIISPSNPLVPARILAAILSSAPYAVKFIPQKGGTLRLEIILVADTEAVDEYQFTDPFTRSSLSYATQLYLVSHGWFTPDMISTIEAAVKLQATHTKFVKLLAEAGMPVIQADFLFHFINGVDDELNVKSETEDED